MIKLEYSQIARKKLKDIRKKLITNYGEDFAKKILKEITISIRRLEMYGDSGIRISEMYDIDTDYYYIFIKHNYFVYRIESDKVIVVNVFNEKEDIMIKLFGISARSKESIDYWGE